MQKRNNKQIIDDNKKEERLNHEPPAVLALFRNVDGEW